MTWADTFANAGGLIGLFIIFLNGYGQISYPILSIILNIIVTIYFLYQTIRHVKVLYVYYFPDNPDVLYSILEYFYELGGVENVIRQAYDTGDSVVKYYFFTIIFLLGMLIHNWIVVICSIAIPLSLYLIKDQIRWVVGMIEEGIDLNDFMEE